MIGGELFSKMLSRPRRAVLDTDTFNEIDDQFALSYALLAPDVLDLQAVVAAPFSNRRAATPGDGMLKSYDEIQRILKLFRRPDSDFAWRGSETYLPDRHTPVNSPGARRIIELARGAHAAGEPLYVLAIAAATNIASALLLAPEITADLVVVWLGAHEPEYERTDEFNLRQDVPAAQVLFDSGVRMIWIPCRNVASALEITLPELQTGLTPAGELGHFLYRRAEELMLERKIDAKVIWDIATVGCFAVPEAFEAETTPAPLLCHDRSWIRDENRHDIIRIRHINREAVFTDMFRHLANFTPRHPDWRHSSRS